MKNKILMKKCLSAFLSINFMSIYSVNATEFNDSIGVLASATSVLGGYAVGSNIRVCVDDLKSSLASVDNNLERRLHGLGENENGLKQALLIRAQKQKSYIKKSFFIDASTKLLLMSGVVASSGGLFSLASKYIPYNTSLQLAGGFTSLMVVFGTIMPENFIYDSLSKNRQGYNEIGDTLGTDLHLACRTNNEQKVALLLSTGACVNDPDEQGRKPLHHAALAGNATIMRQLLERGANPDDKVEKRFQSGCVVSI